MTVRRFGDHARCPLRHTYCDCEKRAHRRGERRLEKKSIKTLDIQDDTV